jgi:hypothetical protein
VIKKEEPVKGRYYQHEFIALVKIKCACCGRYIEPGERFAKFVASYDFKNQREKLVPNCKTCIARDGIDLDKEPEGH